VFPLGHVGLTVALARLAGDRVPALSAAPLWALALGALLPDVLDKPLGHAILDLGNGRILFHTVLFALVVLAAALAISRARPAAAPVALALALGCGTHLLFDRMWEDPQALLWPLLGTEFAHRGFEPAGWIAMLLADAYTQGTEAAGAAALTWVAWRDGLLARVQAKVRPRKSDAPAPEAVALARR